MFYDVCFYCVLLSAFVWQYIEVRSVFPCQSLMPFSYAFPLKFSTILCAHFWPFFFLLETFTELWISKSRMIQRSIICKTQKITNDCNLSDLTDRRNTSMWTTEIKFGIWIMLCFQFLLQVFDFSRYVMSFIYFCISTDLNIDFILAHTLNVNNHFIIILLPFL